MNTYLLKTVFNLNQPQIADTPLFINISGRVIKQQVKKYLTCAFFTRIVRAEYPINTPCLKSNQITES
jgi:hypothetical protein